MASVVSCNATPLLLLLLLFTILVNTSSASRSLTSLVQPPSDLLTYHNGALLQGNVPVSILWYGKFTPSQKSILSDFLLSLSPTTTTTNQPSSPSVANWWNTINDIYIAKARAAKKTHILLAHQISDEVCSLGKSLKRTQISKLAAVIRAKKGGIAVVLTAEDVLVEGFCISSCGSHGSDDKAGTAHIWVGNSATQCPGQCVWSFHQPIYGPQGPSLVVPNGDVGVDGMVIILASMLVGAVRNPFGNGFYQGPKDAPLETAIVCPGVYGKGAYPGYAGELLVDPTSGGSYNANGDGGRRFLLHALFDPSTSSCSTLF